MVAPPEIRDLANAYGVPCLHMRAHSKAAEGDTIVRISYTMFFVESTRTQITLLFEGVPRMTSELGRGQETKSFEAAIEYFLQNSRDLDRTSGKASTD